jgi:hypothetical protein
VRESLSSQTLGIMSNLPTDHEILSCIYEMYRTSYPGKPAGSERGENDPYMPVNLRQVAARLSCNPELLFGRLYYHLDAKHRYKQDNGALVSLFYLNFQGKGHSVHFPFLAAIVAGMNQEHRKTFWSLAFSALALVVSVASLVTTVLKK